MIFQPNQTIKKLLLFVNFFFDESEFSQDQTWASDMTSDGILDITDIVFLVNFIFVHYTRGLNTKIIILI